MIRSETMVRMGDLAVSSTPGHVLVSLGLGSCIGLALIDRRAGIAGLAHIVLPDSQGCVQDNPRKFADLAIPAMLRELESLGTRKARLEGVLVGGAQMFAIASSSLDIGQRNEAAVRERLDLLRIPVLAAAIGGSRGRTIRVDVATASVTVRAAGGTDYEELVAPRPVMDAVGA